MKFVKIKWLCRSMDRISGYGPEDGRSTRFKATEI
jgi:hypothetical protein